MSEMIYQSCFCQIQNISYFVQFNNFNKVEPSIMTDLNTHLHSHLSTLIPLDTLSSWIHKLQLESDSQKQKINTPATNCTNSSWRKNNNAIDKIRRKRDLQMQNNQLQQERSQVFQIGEGEEMKNCSTVTTTKIMIKNKAVFFGQECELPYLHSSDAITHLYARRGQDEKQEEIVMFNPPSSIERNLLTSLRYLHIYHTSIQSLRQLGTGWCNLKQLSIVYGRLIDLSGLSSFSSLEELFISFNQISSLSDVMFHPTIKCIDLERNKIDNMEEVQYLATMDRLEYINLNSNPIMKVKEKRRMVQQKLGKILDLEDHMRLLDYQLSQMSLLHEMEGFENIQVTNTLIKQCNHALSSDDVSFQQLYESFLNPQLQQQKRQQYGFVRYQPKLQPLQSEGDQDQDEIQEEEEAIFTPLFHFLSGQKYYSNTLKKYIEGKLFISLRKQQNNSNSPAHALNSRPNSRLSKFVASTRLDRKEEVESADKLQADKLQALTSDVLSLNKAKRTQLSLGRTKKLMERFDKQTNHVPKLMSTLSSTAACISRPGLKRTSLLTKMHTPSDIDFQLDKRFSKTGSLVCS